MPASPTFRALTAGLLTAAALPSVVSTTAAEAAPIGHDAYGRCEALRTVDDSAASGNHFVVVTGVGIARGHVGATSIQVRCAVYDATGAFMFETGGGMPGAAVVDVTTQRSAADPASTCWSAHVDYDDLHQVNVGPYCRSIGI